MKRRSSIRGIETTVDRASYLDGFRCHIILSKDFWTMAKDSRRPTQLQAGSTIAPRTATRESKSDFVFVRLSRGISQAYIVDYQVSCVPSAIFI